MQPARPSGFLHSQSRDSDRPTRALAFMGASAAGFSLMAVFVKLLTRPPGFPEFELVFFRSAINLVIVYAVMRALREPIPRKGRGLLLFRGVFGFGSLVGLFYTLSRLPLAIAMILSWCSPIFVIFFSALFLRERMGLRSLVWVVTAFAGLVLLVNPGQALGPEFPLQAVVIGLLGSASAALAYVAVRAATARVGVNSIIFCFVGVSTVLSFPLMLRDYQAPSALQWLELLGVGLSASFAQFMMTQGYRYSQAGVVSTMNLLSAGLTAILGWLVFDERLAPIQWLGMAVVMSAIVLLTRSSARPLKASRLAPALPPERA